MAKQPTLWKKRVLVPFWTVRICLMLFIIAAYGYTLRTLNNFQDVVKPAIATVVLFMLMIVIVLLIDVLAIVLFLRDALKPGSFLTMNVFQTGFWAGVLLMDIIAIGRGASTVGLAFSAVVFATFVTLLIYSVLIFKRAKNAALRGQYTPAHNPAVSIFPPYFQAAPPYQQSDAYQSQMTTPAVAHNPYVPPYEADAANDYYQQQPVKPAHIV